MPAQFGNHRFVRVHCVHAAHAPARAHEDAGERVVVALGDGIELVIMALRTGNRGAEEALADSVDDVRDGLLRDAFSSRIITMPALAEAQGHGAEEAFVQATARVHARREEVPGELFKDELFERHVGVEGADEVVAVAPGVLRRRVPLVAVGVRVMHDIHPVPRPALAEVRAGEECVHERLKRARRLVRRKLLHVLRLGRQTGEGEAQAAGQGACVRFWRGLE